MLDMTDENENFFIKLFDKYNLNTHDIDANLERKYEFEPLASYNDMINFLEKKPDRFTKQHKSAAS